MNHPPKFWTWFFGTSVSTGGWRSLVDWWLGFHLLVGVTFGLLVEAPIEEAAKTVVLPLAGILIGLAFAAGGSAAAIAQSSEIERLSGEHPDGLAAYVHPFQLSVLLLMTCLVAWTIGALGVFDQRCWWQCGAASYLVAKSALFMLLSLALRDCWQAISLVQLMLLYRQAVKGVNAKPENPDR